MKVYLRSCRWIQLILLFSILNLGINCSQEIKNDNQPTQIEKVTPKISYEEKMAQKEIREAVPLDDPINVIIKKENLKKEINIFVDSLYNHKSIFPKVKGILLTIYKNTDEDFALQLAYASPMCSERLVGLTDYKYRDLFVYLSTKNELNHDFFELKYEGICDKLIDHL